MKKRLLDYEQLCALGMPTRALVPLALQEMEVLVGGSLFGFIWADAQFQAVDTYVINPADERYTRTYAEEFYNRREAHVGPTFSDILRQRIALVNFSSLGRRMFDSELYNELFRPIGTPHALRAGVFDGGRHHGMLAMTRPPGKGFSVPDEQLILRCARHLAHAFERERAGQLLVGDTVEGASEGVLLLSSQGQLLHACSQGRRLFDEATRADGLALVASAMRETLPVTLAREAMSAPMPKAMRVTHARGAYVFRPFRLRAQTLGTPDQVVVTVRQLGPAVWLLWQRTEGQGLSARERQIVVMLCMGCSYEHMASHLDITRHTLISYVRRAYDKLQVRDRETLQRRVLTTGVDSPEI